MRILDEEGAPPHTVLHCFSGDARMARTAVKRGYLLSFAGTVTFKNATGLRNALAVTPHLWVTVPGQWTSLAGDESCGRRPGGATSGPLSRHVTRRGDRPCSTRDVQLLEPP